MKNLRYIPIILLFCLSAPVFAEPYPGPYSSGDQVMVLCYHDVPKEVHRDNFGVDQYTFVQTIEYLRVHGFHFISLNDLIAAREGSKSLPEKPVLLTFDDAYRSYYDFVFPLLKQYGYPSVLAIVTHWLDEKPKDIKSELMTWEQVREVAQSPLVEIATHTHNLHSGIVYNPQGNQAAAVTSRYYDKAALKYEEEENYRRRIREDLGKTRETFQNRIGISPRVVVWPYGKYNNLAREEAENNGISINFALNDQMASLNDWPVINRYIIYKNPDVEELLTFLKIKKSGPAQQRIMLVDLDLIYDPDPEQTEKNLSLLLDRVKALKVGVVFLQAFSDPKATGNIESVYFPNRVLPMRADLFTRVVHQLKSRCQVSVYAWMPMLSIVLPDSKKSEELRVRSYQDEKSDVGSRYSHRLSPFSEQTVQVLSDLYSDLAVHAWVDGVILEDDGYLTDVEDFHPAAVEEYKKITGGKLVDPASLTHGQRQQWTKVKTQQLLTLSQQLKNAVLRHDPEAKFARTLYAPVLTNPKSEEWFAQNYEESLKVYDYVAIMAFSRMEKVVGSPKRWYQNLVRTIKNFPEGLERTIFIVQAYDWDSHQWIDTKKINEWLNVLVAAGGWHLAYYPDDFTIDQPRAKDIRLFMSQESFPFKRDF